jgi:hypothetical protein
MSPALDIEGVERAAKRMRCAIETLARHELPFGMQDFPAGACGDTSLLLGAYLVDCGYQGFEYTAAERRWSVDGVSASHAWLSCENLVVDITADQFPDGPAAVIVSSQSVWHSKFRNMSKSTSDFRGRSYLGVGDLGRLYVRLKPHLFP